jgi:hypothetical protein
VTADLTDKPRDERAHGEHKHGRKHRAKEGLDESDHGDPLLHSPVVRLMKLTSQPRCGPGASMLGNRTDDHPSDQPDHEQAEQNENEVLAEHGFSSLVLGPSRAASCEGSGAGRVARSAYDDTIMSRNHHIQRNF